MARRPSPFIVQEPEPHRPHLVLLVDTETGRVPATTLVAPDAGDEEVASWVEENTPPGLGLRADDEVLAAAIRSQCGRARRVRVAPTPEVDQVVDALRENLQPDAPPGDVPALRDDSEPEGRRAFYEAAARFEQMAPWDVASDEHVLGVDVHALGWTKGCAIILGGAGLDYGLLLFPSMDDYLAFGRLAELDPQALRRKDETGVAVFSVNFDRPKMVPGGRKLAKQARSLGWTPGPRGWLPWLAHTGVDGVPKPLTTADYDLATAALAGVASFVSAHGRVFEEMVDEDAASTVSVASAAGSVEVTVYVPPEDAPWQWGFEEPLAGLRHAEGDVLIDDYCDDLVSGGLGPADVEAGERAVNELMMFKVEIGSPIDAWTPDDVEAFLLGYLPRNGLVPDSDLEQLPARLAGFFEWLAEWEGAAVDLGRILPRLSRCRNEFLAQARDQGRFGPEKRALLALPAEDVDHDDPQAVEDYMARVTRRIKEEQERESEDEAVRRRPKAWTWTPGEPPPDPKEPCPCGSGRRYRKCCMPR